ncbi:MAG: hypothetical protein KKD39_00835, partial [Candidatus Altiarchaeota archaeon]|nr:hypothetical protein [Candidatus Altiarchaeota archaeon]
ALTYISSVMRFVYIRSLVEGEIRLKEYFSKDAEKGLKLFYLNLLIFLLNIILVLAVVATALYTVGATDDKADFVVFLLLFAILISAIVWIITQALFMWVVNDFTVPVMYAKDLGIVESIKYTLKLIKENIWQFVIYLLVSLAAGIVAAIASIIVLILVLVVFVVVGVLFAVVLLVPFIALGIDPTNISPAILWTLISAALVIFIAAAILFGYATTVILLPIHVFMRYLSLIFLGRTDTTLDLFKNKKKIKPKKKIGMKKVKKEIKVY